MAAEPARLETDRTTGYWPETAIGRQGHTSAFQTIQLALFNQAVKGVAAYMGISIACHTDRCYLHQPQAHAPLKGHRCSSDCLLASPGKL